MSRCRLVPVFAASLVGFTAPSAFAATGLDGARIRTWADQHFNEAVQQRRMNGAVIAVVQHGETIFLHGYGHEDLGRGVRMEPATTQMRICSNSKAFTATALLQLLDAGRIRSLDHRANEYLRRFQLPRVDGRDITLRALLTHRAGFGQGRFNEETDSTRAEPTSALDYRRLLGGFTNAPDTISSYSNSGAAVLGAVIEDVSGESFPDYLRAHIFEPLGMAHSLVHTGGPPPARLAVPYRYFPDGSQERVILFGKHPVFAPSGGVISTAGDMALFLAAHADEGRTASSPLLKPSTFEEMHTQTVSNHAALDGFGLQYFTSRSRGERVLSHTCSLPGFSSAQVIFPDRNAAIFVAVVAEQVRALWWEYALAPLVHTRMSKRDGVIFNRPLQASDALDDLRREATDLPPEAPEMPVAAQLAGDLEAYTGTYVVDRRPVGSMVSLAAAINGMMRVSHGANGALLINERVYFQIAPDVFQRVDAPESRYAFLRNKEGRIARLAGVSSTYTPVSGGDDPSLAAKVILWSMLAGVTGLFALRWPGAGVWARGTRWAMAAAAGAAIAVLWSLGFGFDPSGGVNDISDAIGIGSAGRLWTVLIAANVWAIAGVLMLAAVVPAWRARWWGTGRRGISRRIHFSIVALLVAATVPFLASFHVIGFRITPAVWPATQFDARATNAGELE